MFKSKLNQGDKTLWHGNHKTLYQKKKKRQRRQVSGKILHVHRLENLIVRRHYFPK